MEKIYRCLSTFFYLLGILEKNIKIAGSFFCRQATSDCQILSPILISYSFFLSPKPVEILLNQYTIWATSSKPEYYICAISQKSAT